MSVDNHRHCQATVLGATGDPYDAGLTWSTITNLNLPKLPTNWVNEFRYNQNITDDLADILKLINWAVDQIPPVTIPEPQNPLPGDIIDIPASDGRTVNVKNDIGQDYTGVVGITTGPGRHLTECPIRVINKDKDGPVIATLWVGDQSFEIKALKVQEPRYVITEDGKWDIVLSGGGNDGDPLDYRDE